MANDWWDYLRADIREDDDDLSHYGTLGQKWGVRRFQDEYGHLTPEGVERYRKLGNKRVRLEAKAAKYQKKAANHQIKGLKTDRKDLLYKSAKESKKVATIEKKISKIDSEKNKLDKIQDDEHYKKTADDLMSKYASSIISDGLYSNTRNHRNNYEDAASDAYSKLEKIARDTFSDVASKKPDYVYKVAKEFMTSNEYKKAEFARKEYYDAINDYVRSYLSKDVYDFELGNIKTYLPNWWDYGKIETFGQYLTERALDSINPYSEGHMNAWKLGLADATSSEHKMDHVVASLASLYDDMQELEELKKMEEIDLGHSEFLSHHGILGQKWGLKRFQDELGYLTLEDLKKSTDNKKSVVQKNLSGAAKAAEANKKYWQNKKEQEEKALSVQTSNASKIGAPIPAKKIIKVKSQKFSEL